VRTRASLARTWCDQGLAPVTVIAHAMRVSRQCCYRRVVGCRARSQRASSGHTAAGTRAEGPIAEHLDVETALHVLARRHVAAGYRKVCARARRAGYGINRKRVARLLRVWGFTRARRRPHPKAQGRPFDITKPNELWQTDLSAVWCGEDGWAYFTAVLDCFDRSILGWSFTRRCRTWT
jgi:putative transposase